MFSRIRNRAPAALGVSEHYQAPLHVKRTLIALSGNLIRWYSTIYPRLVAHRPRAVPLASKVHGENNISGTKSQFPTVSYLHIYLARECNDLLSARLIEQIVKKA